MRSMTKVATLTGHTYRVLYLAISPDGQTVVTGAGDETLRTSLGQRGAGEGSGRNWTQKWGLLHTIYPIYYVGPFKI